MSYLERLKRLNTHQGPTDKTDKSTSVSFVSPPQVHIERSVAADWRTFMAQKRSPPAHPGERAEAVAHNTRVVEWLNANPASSAPDRCAECGRADAPGATLIPFGGGAHVWLHLDCWRAWYNKRLAEAGAACLLHP